jgi:hypothetical protein
MLADEDGAIDTLALDELATAAEDVGAVESSETITTESPSGNIHFYHYVSIYNTSHMIPGGRRGRDRMVVGFIELPMQSVS